MGVPVVGHGAARRDQRLGDCLPAEDPAEPLLLLATDKTIPAPRLQIEEQRQFGDQLLGRRPVSGLAHHAIEPCAARRRQSMFIGRKGPGLGRADGGTSGRRHAGANPFFQPPARAASSSSATILVILIIGLTAGPAVSL